MTCVSVVATYHGERGLTNASALVTILERIKPEVIFLECPPAAFDSYLNGAYAELEPAAVNRYRENHRVDLIPVDLPTPDEDFFANDARLHTRIEKTSPDYCRLVDWNSQYVSKHGFPYLNSEYCSALFAELHEAMLAAIVQLRDRELAELYELSNRTKERREEEMMKNLERYCTQTSFSSGAFLVGAAHRQSIIDMSRRQPGGDSSTIQWDFARFLEEANRAEYL